MEKKLIIVDTREQKPIWDPTVFEVKSMKLDEGDYTTEDLLNKAHIERKSPTDLYGSIIQGHNRFRDEIKRAIEKNIRLAIFVECPEEMFYKKRFPQGFRLKTPEAKLRKIISTMKRKYDLEFVWCEDRDDMMEKMLLWFVEQRTMIFNKKGENKKPKLSVLDQLINVKN